MPAVRVVQAVALDDVAAAAEVEEDGAGRGCAVEGAFVGFAGGWVWGTVDVDFYGSLGVAGGDVEGFVWGWGYAGGEGVGQRAEKEGDGFEEEIVF
ncbi:unnamed protein product [Aspergillus oryzae]|nr:unnamed protein product [Aspergillus oryzae]